MTGPQHVVDLVLCPVCLCLSYGQADNNPDSAEPWVLWTQQHLSDCPLAPDTACPWPDDEKQS